MNTVITIVSCMLIAMCAIFSKDIALSVKSGLLLAATTAVPALFPASVISGMLTASGAAIKPFERMGKMFGKIFGVSPICFLAYVLGILAGYPTGAVVLSDLRKNGLITADDAARSCAICVNCGISFVFGVSASYIREGILLFAIHILAGLLAGKLTIWICEAKSHYKNNMVTSYNFTDNTGVKLISYKRLLKSFTESVSSAALGMLKLCALIALFRPITDILGKLTSNNSFSGIIISFFELTSGVTACSGSNKLVQISFALGFGGLCVLAQCLSFLSDSDIQIRQLVIGKILHGIISAILCAGILFFGKMCYNII